jgi:hypothetical protein
MWTLPTGASPTGASLVWASALTANKVSNTTRKEKRRQNLPTTTRALLPLNVLPTNFIGCTSNYRPNLPTAQIRFNLQLAPIETDGFKLDEGLDALLSRRDNAERSLTPSA